jgi:hypothetical protein
MPTSSHQEADESIAKDPHKASWQHDDQIEPVYDADQTAGVVTVESETLALAYQVASKSYIRDNYGEEPPKHWYDTVGQNIVKRFNVFLQLDHDHMIFDAHPLGRLILMNVLDDLKDGLSATDLYWEDVIGFSLIPGTVKINLHFSIEGLDNGGITP